MNTISTAWHTAIARITAPGAPFEIAPLAAGGVEYRAYRQAPPSLAAVYAQAAAHGEREFLCYEGERWSFADLFACAGEIAAGLQAAGIARGDRVAIAMRNYPEWMSAFIAITASGAVAVPLNSWNRAAELEHALADAGARLVFCDTARAAMLRDYAQRSGCRLVVVRADVPLHGVERIEDFRAAHAGALLPNPVPEPEAPALLMYTSGTTGAAKGALSTQRAVCQAILNFECMAMASAMIDPEAIAAMTARGFPPVQLLAVPLFHVSGCHAVFLTALRAGRRIVMMHKWDVARALELIAAERVTIVSGAPAMLQQLLESPDFARADTRSLCSLGAGGAATPPRTARLLHDAIPDGYPGTGWGLTESNGIGSAFTGAPFRARPGSAGFVHPTVELQVRDAENRVLGRNCTGNLWLRSPTLASGYWDHDMARAQPFAEGWFDTGDIGYLDDAGYLFLSDRAKDLVIRGGENIHPAEVEAALLEFPGVAEVAAFGVPDETFGEELAVAVLERPGSRVDAQALREFAAGRLAHFKVPRFVVLRSEALPRNAAGKVLKRQLRAEFLAA